MRKLLILSTILFFTVTQSFAYSIKVYDEYGNRVGTYKKEGENYQLYDFNDKKVDSPEMIIKDAPSQKTLTEYTRTFYDENMMPVGTWRSGFYGSNGRYYPRNSEYIPAGFHKSRTPYIVRPHSNFNHNGIYKYADYKDNVNYVDTRYPKFHEFVKP